MKLGNSQVTNSRRYTDWPTGKAKNREILVNYLKKQELINKGMQMIKVTIKKTTT